MRIRLIVSFVIIVLVSITTMLVIARINAANEVRQFMFGGGMSGNEGLVDQLEAYYEAHQSWQGVDSVFSDSGHGGRFGQGKNSGRGQLVRLIDTLGTVLIDTSGGATDVSVSSAEMENGIPLSSGNDIVGYLLPEIATGFNRGDETQLVERLNRAALIAGLITGGLSLLIVSILAYTLLKPVHDLTIATDKIAQGDLSQRVPVHGTDELAKLGSAFNRMADSLENAETNRRAMTADIAHELRNPLAVQRANLEALQDGIYELNADNLQTIIGQNMLLTRLVEDLRTLALADAGQLEMVRIHTDFPALVKRVIDRFQTQAISKEINLEMSSSGVCQTILIDPERIEQILGNLLSNALRYTPEKGKISFELVCESGKIRLDIHDSGPGIPADALPHVFQRFYRADRSRSRADGGSGLGLAISLKIAEANGGNLTVANHPKGGAVFTLTLPYSG